MMQVSVICQDVPAPFKKELPEYQERENRLLSMIYKKFLGSDLSEEEQIQLKEIDRAMLWYDLKRLLKEPQSGEAPQLHMELNYKVRSFSEVEKEYLALFARYSELSGNCRIYDISDDI